MKKILIKFLFFFIFLISLSDVQGNFACGILNNSENYSSSWENVFVYYSDNPLEYSTCKVNPEKKFCCDLDEIKSIKWEKGKLIFAEVFDSETGYFAGPVSLITSEEGYDVFPEMSLKKAIKLNSPIKKILINESYIVLNLTLDEKFNNLNFSEISSSRNFSQELCKNCTDISFNISLEKGKNLIDLVAYRGREIHERFNIYSLDYLNISSFYECKGCYIKGKKVFLPSDTEINLTISITSSHKINQEISIYFPKDWLILNNSFIEDYSDSHSKIRYSLSENFSNIFLSFKTPKIFLNRNDFLRYEIGDFFIDDKVIILKIGKFFPIHSSKKFSKKTYFDYSLKNQISPQEPLVLLNLNHPNFDLIAIYPKKSIKDSFISLIYTKKQILKPGVKVYEFHVLTNVPKKDIEKVLLRFKIPKNKSIELKNSLEIIPINKYKEDSFYEYFEVYLDNLDVFRIKVF